MAIVYKCRHCKQLIGRIEQAFVDTTALGWQTLTANERKEMVHYATNGDIEMHVICEDCQETLEHYPDYHALDTFIQ